MKPLRIGMYGGGTVGGGVYELIMKNKASNIVISKICVRDLSKPRTFQIDESVTTLTADVEEMMKSDDIDCVVEGAYPDCFLFSFCVDFFSPEVYLYSKKSWAEPV